MPTITSQAWSTLYNFPMAFACDLLTDLRHHRHPPMKLVSLFLSTSKRVLSTLDNGDILPKTLGRLGCKVEHLLTRGKGTWEDDDIAAILTGAFVTTVVLGLLLAQGLAFV